MAAVVQPVLSPKELAKMNKQLKDSSWLATHIPQKATRRSALIPGWGQAYNREYWKLPLVYGILAIPAVTYFYNTSFYKKTKFAYEARFKEQTGDSSDVSSIDPELRGLSIASLQNYRNAFRRDRDYSILWFILAWGLQVVDATVFGHLRHFDVSNSLSMQVHPQLNPTTRTPALTLSFNIKEKSKKPLAIAR
ncbi:MAG: DUF5683 domain-containing protein [Sediminibacterium sp.]